MAITKWKTSWVVIAILHHSLTYTIPLVGHGQGLMLIININIIIIIIIIIINIIIII